MNRLKRFGKETETDRSCRVKMYKAGKNWLTSCQICRYFLNRAVLKRVAVSAGAVAIGMSLSGHVVKADTTSSTNRLITISSTVSQANGPSAATATTDNADNSNAVATVASSSTVSSNSQAASSSTDDSKTDSVTQSSSSAAASAGNDQNDAASSTAADSQTAASSAVEKSSVVSAKLATANRIARVAMVNATAESTELAVQTTDYQALTKDWNVDAKGNVTYTGKSMNLTTITIPHNYDFYQAGKTKANQKLTIAASVIHNLLKQNRDLTELIISGDSNGKLYATGNWTAAFSGYDDNYMNQYNSKIKSLVLGGLDVAGVTNMSRMFYGDNQLVRITGLSNWNTAKVTDMSYMFSGTSKLSSKHTITNRI